MLVSLKGGHVLDCFHFQILENILTVIVLTLFTKILMKKIKRLLHKCWPGSGSYFQFVRSGSPNRPKPSYRHIMRESNLRRKIIHILLARKDGGEMFSPLQTCITNVIYKTLLNDRMNHHLLSPAADWEDFLNSGCGKRLV